jgi:hypothetical protein
VRRRIHGPWPSEGFDRISLAGRLKPGVFEGDKYTTNIFQA